MSFQYFDAFSINEFLCLAFDQYLQTILIFLYYIHKYLLM